MALAHLHEFVPGLIGLVQKHELPGLRAWPLIFRLDYLFLEGHGKLTTLDMLQEIGESPKFIGLERYYYVTLFVYFVLHDISFPYSRWVSQS